MNRLHPRNLHILLRRMSCGAPKVTNGRIDHENILHDREPELPDIPRLFQLPGELRSLIYTFYFEDAHITGTDPQRQTKHATALLFVNRQIHAEAADVMYKSATLTIDLGKDYAPVPRRDVIHLYGNEHVMTEDWCSVKPVTLERFHNIELIFDTPRSDLKPDDLAYAYPMLNAYLTQLRVGQHVRVMLNLGVLKRLVFASPLMRAWRPTYADINFSTPRESHGGNTCTEKCTVECKRHNAEERAYTAQTLANVSTSDVEAFCIVMAVITLGQNARFSGADFYVQVSGGEKKFITADNAVDVIEQAEGLYQADGVRIMLEGRWGGYFV